jgi:hypothetical protein
LFSSLNCATESDGKFIPRYLSIKYEIKYDGDDPDKILRAEELFHILSYKDKLTKEFGQKIVLHGKYYRDVESRYPNYLGIQCNFCNCECTSSYGYSTYDVCMSCAKTLNN